MNNKIKSLNVVGDGAIIIIQKISLYKNNLNMMINKIKIKT